MTLTLEEEILVVAAYQRDPKAAEAFFAGQSGTKPRPLDVVKASLPKAVERLTKRIRGEE